MAPSDTVRPGSRRPVAFLAARTRGRGRGRVPVAAALAVALSTVASAWVGVPATGSETTASKDGYRHPEYLAGATLVRVEATAHVTVGEETTGRHELDVPVDDETTRTGFFIGPDVVVTNPGRIRRMLGTYAVNRVFAASLPADAGLFRQHHATDAATDRTLQSCYRWLTVGSSCTVRIRMELSVRPYDSDDGTFPVVSARSDSDVTFLVLGCGAESDCSELTLPVADGPPVGPFVTVAASGAHPVTPKVSGMLTGDPAEPLSGTEATAAAATLGTTAAGAPLVSPQGEVVGMLARGPNGFAVVPGSRILEDAAAHGVVPGPGTYNDHLYTGLTFLEHGDFAPAASLLTRVAEASGQKVVADLATRAQEGAAEHAGAGEQRPLAADVSATAGSWPWVGGGALAVLVAVGLVLGLRRRAAAAGPPLVDTEAFPGPGAVGQVAPERAPVRPVRVAPVFCGHCAAQLASGDQVCGSCGAPIRRRRPT